MLASNLQATGILSRLCYSMRTYLGRLWQGSATLLETPMSLVSFWEAVQLQPDPVGVVKAGGGCAKSSGFKQVYPVRLAMFMASFFVWSAWLGLRGMCCVAGIKIIKRSQASFSWKLNVSARFFSILTSFIYFFFFPSLATVTQKAPEWVLIRTHTCLMSESKMAQFIF